jgi:hypothetical protein
MVLSRPFTAALPQFFACLPLASVGFINDYAETAVGSFSVGYAKSGMTSVVGAQSQAFLPFSVNVNYSQLSYIRLQAQAAGQAKPSIKMQRLGRRLSLEVQNALWGEVVRQIANKASPEQALLHMVHATSAPRYIDLRKQPTSIFAAQDKIGSPAMDYQVTETLRQPLKDQYPEVRAQTVFGIMNQDSINIGILHENHRDNNPNVSLMTVDSADANHPFQRISSVAGSNDDAKKRISRSRVLPNPAKRLPGWQAHPPGCYSILSGYKEKREAAHLTMWQV